MFHNVSKYVNDMLAKFGMTGCKPIGTPLDVNLKLRPDEEEILKDSTMYRGSLNYLTVTRPDIAYAVSAVSQFMQEPGSHTFMPHGRSLDM